MKLLNIFILTNLLIIKVPVDSENNEVEVDATSPNLVRKDFIDIIALSRFSPRNHQ